MNAYVADFSVRTSIRRESRVESFIRSTVFDRPTLVIDVDRVEEQYHALKAGLGHARIHYAVKANPQREIIERLVDLGSGFDAASRAEIELCLSLGARPENISFGNTVKKVRDIEFAFHAGVTLFAADAEEELEKNFEAVRREALSSFGNPGVLVEKFIVNPHHIEVQILADNKGNIFHCYERECSVQRRHQKIIEEAPSPFIGADNELRQEICSTAVRLAQEVQYNSAGTVEFIMGEDKSFYFLEMNTRIQVEHPITEQITGIDLVANMIKAALGEDMDFNSQDEVYIQGHAIECRICAEDPVTMLPAPGKVSAFDFVFPQGVRFDHCIYNGFEVKPDFDPMIGKLIATGSKREVALRKVRNAIKNLYIDGIKTNIHLHEIIIEEENFVAGSYTTNYISEVSPQTRVEDLILDDSLYKKAIAIELHEMRENI